MRKYLDLEGFISFIGGLELDKPEKFYTKSLEDGEVSSYSVKKEEFAGNFIYLYETPYCCVGTIQETPVATVEDYREGVFEEFEQEGDYNIFIEEE